MNILLIGGSNLVVVAGMSGMIPVLFEEAGTKIESCDNLSVGGTGSLFGMENLAAYAGTERDLIIIEYGINDLETYGRDRKLWEMGFRGLLSLTRERFPGALIATVLLGQRTEWVWAWQRQMHLEMTALSVAFNALVVDIDAHLKAVTARPQFDALYSDDAHYQLPVAAELVSREVVLRCLESLASVSGAITIEPPAEPLSLHLTIPCGTTQSFGNSRFTRNATVIAEGGCITLDTPGVPVGLSFVSLPDSCAAHLSLDGRTLIVSTLGAKVNSGQFKFLIKHVPLVGMGNLTQPFPGSSRLHIRAINSQSAHWTPDAVYKDALLVPPDSGKHLYLCAVTSFAPPGQTTSFDMNGR